MDNMLDGIWEHVETFLSYIVMILDKLISPLEFFGAGFVIFFLTVLVVFFTRFVSKHYVTRRSVRLKKEFEHWKTVREEAMKHPDRDKARALAKNVDQAELNRAYYDYFFEGFLKNMVVNVMPVLLTAAYVTTIYTPETLYDRFGEKWIFSFSTGSSMVNVSSLFWYVISLSVSFVLYMAVKRMVKKRKFEKAFV